MQHNFQFISKHSSDVQRAYDNLQDILRQIHQNLRAQYRFQHKIIGSYSRNLITYDTMSNIGYDFDVDISPHDGGNLTPKEIKLRFKQVLDQIATKYGYDYAEDSKRVLTIKVKDRIHSRILYHVDFCFVKDYEDMNGSSHQEYIHFEKKQKHYYWAEQSNSFYRLPDRIKWLKEEGLWQELRRRYLDKKNRNNDPDKRSRSLLTEAVNEIYQQYSR